MAGNKSFSLDGPLYNGARDEEGGIWIRVDSLIDHRILKAAIDKAIKNKESADNTVNSLDPEASTKLTYIDASLQRIKHAVIGALPPSEQLAGTPIGKAIEEQKMTQLETPDELEPSAVEIEDTALLAALKDEGADVVAIPDTWSNEDRRNVYRWLRALHLTKGGARRDLAVPARPAFVPLEWFTSTPEIRQGIEDGAIDEDTLAPVDLIPEQQNYWLAQGPWRITEYSQDGESPGDPPRIEFAIEWGEMIEAKEGDGPVEPPTHPFVYDTRDAARDVAAKMNRRMRLDVAEDDDEIIAGEPLPVKEALLTEDLQNLVIKDLNDTLRAQGDSKTIIDKHTLAIGALRKWYRAGPYSALRVEDEGAGDEKTARYRVVKEIEPGRNVGTLTSYDHYEAIVRAALWNRAEFQTGELWGKQNEAATAVEEGAKKKTRKKRGGRKGGTKGKDDGGN